MQNFTFRPAQANPLAEVARSPRWFPHALDPATDRVLLVEKSEADYRSASFLDDRALAPNGAQHVAAWRDLEAALPAEARRDAGYIFHIGHVGSTLISRLLGELPGVFALREPVLLRNFHDLAMLSGQPESPWAPEWLDQRITTLRALLSRTFRPEQRAIVKATSFTSELAPRFVGNSRALLLYTGALPYLENILAGETSRQEVHALAGQRLKRLSRRLGEVPWKLWDLSFGQRAALAWACEMTSLAAASDALGESVRWSDFDAFLADPAARLREIAHFFGQPLDEAGARQIVEGPLMRRYSKGLEYEYSPDLRAQVLAQSRDRNRAEIREAMAWLEEAAGRFPVIADALGRKA
jgi:hypothetical protein